MTDIDKLDAAWRAASREEPPSALDDALRAAARRAVSAAPSRGSRARHMYSWPLAAAAIVAVLAIGIVQLTPPEQVTPTIVADSASRQTASKEKAEVAPTQTAAPAAPGAVPGAGEQVAATSAPADRISGAARKQLAQPSNAPPPKPSVEMADKRQGPPRSGAEERAAGTVAQAPGQERDAPKSKLETADVDGPVKKAPAEPFPAATGETKNSADVQPAAPPPLAAAKPEPAPPRANAIDAHAARRDEVRAAPAPGSALAKVAPERERAKDSAPRTPDEWIKLIRRLQSEGRKEEVTKELAAFRAEYKERADALLPADLREIK